MNLNRVQWSLLAAKALVFGGAVALDLVGRLGTDVTAVICTALLSLGGAHVVALLRHPPAPGAVHRIADLLVDLVGEMRRANATLPPPAPATAPHVPTLRPLPPPPIIAPAVALVLLAALAGALAACTSARQRAIDAYDARILQCAALGSSREAIDACRVDARSQFCAQDPAACGEPAEGGIDP